MILFVMQTILLILDRLAERAKQVKSDLRLNVDVNIDLWPELFARLLRLAEWRGGGPSKREAPESNPAICGLRRVDSLALSPTLRIE